MELSESNTLDCYETLKFVGCWRGVAFFGSGHKMVHTVQRRVVSLELLVILVSNWKVFEEGRKGKKNCKNRVEGT